MGFCIMLEFYPLLNLNRERYFSPGKLFKLASLLQLYLKPSVQRP